MFSTEDRERLRDELVSIAHADPRISAAALTGSAAVGREDRWSDIDLAVCVAPDAGRAPVMADWTNPMYAEHSAVHHFDVYAAGTPYRVFLLLSTLQVDISFWLPSEFGALGPNFRLLFGTAATARVAAVPAAGELIGMGWLYALHARSSIARGRVWQAEYMISGVRDQVLALAYLRHGVPAVQGRGMDSLPREVTAPIAQALVESLDIAELKRAFAAAKRYLTAEEVTLRAKDVDIATIALWLGHESTQTTHIYEHADPKLKEQAIARTAPLGTKPGRYRPSDALLAFLDGL